jgi:hypothetical protein
MKDFLVILWKGFYHKKKSFSIIMIKGKNGMTTKKFFKSIFFPIERQII